MARFFLAIATGCLMSGCAASGVDVNVDPFAKSSADMSALAPDPGRAMHRTVPINPRILQQISTAKSASPRNEVPSYYVEKSCKTRSLVGDNDTYDFCIQQEMAAKDMLAKAWKSYSAEARNECAPVSPEPGNSYVALMTCFEMLEWIKDPASIGGVTGGGATHAKSVSDSQPSQAGEPAEQAASSPNAPAPPQP